MACAAAAEAIAHATLVPVKLGANEDIPVYVGGEADAPCALWEFTVRGQAFMWHQVRCMVAVLFLVGEGKEAASITAELLDVSRAHLHPLDTITLCGRKRPRRSRARGRTSSGCCTGR